MDSVDLGMALEGFGAALYGCELPAAAVVAFRGTVNLANMQSDVYLFFVEAPLHLRLALEFCDLAHTWLRDHQHPGRHSLAFTGHSLGAAVALCCAYTRQAAAVTFDSPGERTLLERMGHTDFSAARCSRLVSYLAEPNAVSREM